MTGRRRLLGWSVGAWLSAILLATALGSFLAVEAAGSDEGNRHTSQTTQPESQRASESYANSTPYVPGPEDSLIPVGGSQVATVDDAEKAVGYTVPIPSDVLASSSSVTDVWVGGNEVAVRFASGVRMYVTPWPKGVDVKGSFQRQVDETGVGYVTQIEGEPVMVFPKDVQAPGYPPQTNVTVVLGGVSLEIWGDQTVDELLNVVRSTQAATLN